MATTTKTEPLHITVVASGGEFTSAQIFLPGDKLQEHPRTAWSCDWCGWVCVAPTLKEVPPHTCLSNKDGVERVF